jgi:hypothetical protein
MVQESVASSAVPYADLLIRITPELIGRWCRIDLAFTLPGAQVPAEHQGRALFDLDALREVQNDLAEYGRRLGAALFADEPVREGFVLAVALAGTQQLRVRLYVDSDAPELHSIRWEALRTPGDLPIATGDRVLFSRYLRSPDWRRVALVPERDLRALILISNPSDLDRYSPEGVPLQPIDVAGELDRARRALDGIRTTEFAEPGSATVQNLINGIRSGHNLIYVVCHGALIKGETRLFLERESGESTTITGEELAQEFRQLRQLPALVVLAACQSAGSATGGALSAVGPLLARAGVPSVLAMQERVSMPTASQFVETFFTELRRDGRLDRAAAAARSRVKGEPDFWVPVLYTRLANACMWPPPAQDTDDFQKRSAVIDQIRKGTCTPIIGPGLLEFLLGPSRELAQGWADTFHFPMSPSDRQALPQVAQFLAVEQSPEFPADELARYVHGEIVARYGQLLPHSMPNEDEDDYVRALVSEVGRRKRANDETDAYRVLANLPLPIYVSTNPDNLLCDALVEAGKQPVVELGRWNDQVEIDSIWDSEPDYKPTVERPLIYHVFGQLRTRESLVLTEDNYFDFLLRVGTSQWRVPDVIAAAWAKNALMFLGFQMDEWSFRVLFRTIMSQPGRSLGNKKPHIAVQIDPEEGSSLYPQRARKYLEQYFGEEHITTYWGSAERFMQEIWAAWSPPRMAAPAASISQGLEAVVR